MTTLFHFTGGHHASNISREGINKGRIVKSLFPFSFIDGWQWLTVNPEFDQSWNRQVFLKEDRSMLRFTVNIPRKARGNLYKWDQHGMKLISRIIYDDLSFMGDPENWFIYKGAIRQSWLKSVALNPKYDVEDMLRESND